MGCLSHAHEQPLNWTGQTSWSAACGHGRDLDLYDGQVRTQGGWTGGEGDLWDGEILRGSGGGNIGGHSRDASLVGAARPGG